VRPPVALMKNMPRPRNLWVTGGLSAGVD
jgi:hypothetical protein